MEDPDESAASANSATRAMRTGRIETHLRNVNETGKWRLRSESNRRTRLCRPLHDHSATQPEISTNADTPLSIDEELGAGNETRTRDPNLGKVVLYQLSYSRSHGVAVEHRMVIVPDLGGK